MGKKSEGLLQFERETAELEKRDDGGEFEDWSAALKEFLRVLGAAMPKMTRREQVSIQRNLLRTHQMLAENLAKHGRPVAGSDPKKPN